MATTTHTTARRLAMPGTAAAELERTLPWLLAEEGRITDEQYYLTRAGLVASCYVIPPDCAHTGYATWQMLFGRPVRSLVDPIPDDERRARTSTELAELAARLPAGATGTLAVVTPGSTRPGISGTAPDGAAPDGAAPDGAAPDGAAPEGAAPAEVATGELAALVAGIEDLAGALGLPVVAIGNVRDEPACAGLRRVLRERGYLPVTTGADAVLDVPAGDLDSYFAGFRANRRKVMRKERARFLTAGRSVTVSGPDGLTDDLVELQLKRYAQYGHQVDRAAVLDRFRRAVRIPGLTVLRADSAAGPLGFVGFYLDRPHRRVVTRLGAFVRDDMACYFNLAYYELIAYAAAAGGLRIHYGESTYRAKTARGCRLVRLETYFRAADPDVHRVIAAAGRIRTRLELRQLSDASTGAGE